jgi:hypothetical protein
MVLFPPVITAVHGNVPDVLAKFGLQAQEVTEQHSEQVDPEFEGQLRHSQVLIS